MPASLSSTVNNLDEAIEKLAAVAAEARLRRKYAMPSLSDAFSALKSQATAHPTAALGLGGAALGGLYGGLTSLGQEPEERQPLSRALTGALAGGAAGIGAGMLHEHLPPLLDGQSTHTMPQKENLGPGVFIHNGKKMQINPDTPGLPDLNQKVHELMSRDPASLGVGQIADWMHSYAKKYPVLAGVAGADAMSHVGGRLAERFNPGGSLNPQHLAAGVKNRFGDTSGGLKAEKGLGQRLSQMIHNSTPDELQKIMAGVRSGVGIGGKEPISAEYLRHLIEEGTPAGGRLGGFRSLMDVGQNIAKGIFPNYKPDPLLGTGYRNSSNVMSGSTALATQPNTWYHRARTGASQIEEAPGMLNRALRGINRIKGPTTPAHRLGGRLGLYGGIPLAMWFAERQNQNAQNNEAVQQLMQRVLSNSNSQ